MQTTSSFLRSKRGPIRLTIGWHLSHDTQLNTHDVAGTNQGHDLGFSSLFTRTDGTKGEATTIYFQSDGQGTTPNEAGYIVPKDMTNLPYLPRGGTLHTIGWAAGHDPVLKAELTALVQGSSTLSSSELHAAFEQILLRWAGARLSPWQSWRMGGCEAQRHRVQ